jgi:hypothetical protein
MFFNFGQMLIDGGGEPTPAKQSEKAPTVTSSFNPGRFRQAEERSMQEYQSYRSGERQSTVVDEKTKIAEAKELAQQRALAKKAQDDAKIAVSEAQEALRRAREAQAKAQQDEAIRRAEEELRRAKEEEERRKRAALEADNSPSNTTYFSAPDPIPLTPSTIVSQPTNISPVTQTPPPPPVKTAPIDTILFDEEAVPIQIMSDLIFENIGGQELINVARNDTVNGQQIIYQPIKNLTQIQQEYNPNNILALQATSDKYFKNFAIKFETKVPNVGGGPDGEHIYIDPTTGELIVEAINMQEDEQIEVEITTGGTIYEAEL